MSEYVEVVAPAWMWIVTVLGLLFLQLAMGALLWHVLGIRHLLRRQNDYEGRVATVDEVDAIAAKLHERLTRVERAKGIPVLWARDDEATNTVQSTVAP